MSVRDGSVKCRKSYVLQSCFIIATFLLKIKNLTMEKQQYLKHLEDAGDQ